MVPKNPRFLPKRPLQGMKGQEGWASPHPEQFCFFLFCLLEFLHYCLKKALLLKKGTLKTTDLKEKQQLPYLTYISFLISEICCPGWLSQDQQGHLPTTWEDHLSSDALLKGYLTYDMESQLLSLWILTAGQDTGHSCLPLQNFSGRIYPVLRHRFKVWHI